MNKRGFALTELIVVIAIIATLLTMATFGFSQYIRKSQIASQTKILYGDLMEYRVKAMYEKRNWTVKVSATGYGIYSSATTSVAPVKTVTMNHPVEFNNTADIVFDGQGVANVSGKTVCVSSTNDAVVDSLVISATRVQIGKKMEGENCVASKIIAR